MRFFSKLELVIMLRYASLKWCFHLVDRVQIDLEVYSEILVVSLGKKKLMYKLYNQLLMDVVYIYIIIKKEIHIYVE